jgi:hypothetical protein
MPREVLPGILKGRLGERIGGRTWWDRRMRFGADGLLLGFRIFERRRRIVDPIEEVLDAS